MNELVEMRDKILLAILPDVAFDGWSWGSAREGVARAGFAPDMLDALFPGGLPDLLAHFSDWADREMLAALEGTDPQDLKIRARVRMAAAARFQVLAPWKEAVRHATSYWAVPTRAPRAARLVWRTADRIWAWAGFTDGEGYSRYTRRILLSGVLTSTMLAWMDQDAGADMDRLGEFLDRRIDNVLKIGQFVGRFKKTG